MFLVLAISNSIRLCEKQEFGYFVSGWISGVIGYSVQGEHSDFDKPVPDRLPALISMISFILLASPKQSMQDFGSRIF